MIVHISNFLDFLNLFSFLLWLGVFLAYFLHTWVALFHFLINSNYLINKKGFFNMVSGVNLMSTGVADELKN